MNPRPLGVLNSLPSPPNILLIASRETANDRNVTITINSIPNLLSNGLDSLEIVVGGGGESSLDDVDAKPSELASNVELLLGGEGGTGGLLPVAESGVEYADVGRVGDAVRDVIGAASCGSGSGVCWGWGLGVRTRDGGFFGGRKE